MKIVLNFEEMSQIILAHVRTKMNVVVDKVDIPSAYTTRSDFCLVTTAEVQQVAPQQKPVAPPKDPVPEPSYHTTWP